MFYCRMFYFTCDRSFMLYAPSSCFLYLDVEATGASGGRMAMAGRLRQLASEAREDRAAVNGGNVRYHGGSAVAGTDTALAAWSSRTSDD